MEKKAKCIKKKKKISPSDKKNDSPKAVKKKSSPSVVVEKEKEINETKYSDKLQSLITKIKSQNEPNSFVKIRFGWK